MVYMKQGGLTYADETMLLDAKDQVQQRLEEQGLDVEWLWLVPWLCLDHFKGATGFETQDLSVERQIRSLLDPPALPSAMILQGTRTLAPGSGRVKAAASRNTCWLAIGKRKMMRWASLKRTYTTSIGFNSIQ